MNSWSLIGRLAADPEVKFSTKGDAILSMKLALDTGWGENKKTLWVKCVGFGKRFEKVGEMLAKGSQVGITGELTSDHWVGKDGNKVPQLEVRISDVTLIGKRETGDSKQKPVVEDSESDVPW